VVVIARGCQCRGRWGWGWGSGGFVLVFRVFVVIGFIAAVLSKIKTKKKNAFFFVFICFYHVSSVSLQ
jgi:hypothetical protein